MFICVTSFIPNQGGSIVLDIGNIQLPKGSIQLALYREPKTFLKDRGSCYGQIIEVKSTAKVQVVINDLNYGQYALAVFHDTDNNGILDKNWLGIPTEPYAFAKKEPSKWRDPAFEEVAFQLDKPKVELSVLLKYWKER